MSEMWVQHLDDVPGLWDKLPELAALKHTQRGEYEALLLRLERLGYTRLKELDKSVQDQINMQKRKAKKAAAPAKDEWPRALAYDKDDDALNAKMFLTARPYKLIALGKEFFSTFETPTGSILWRSLTDLELGNEICKTDAAGRLKSKIISAMVRRLQFSTQSNARPFEWIHKTEGVPSPQNTVLFRNGLLNLDSGELLQLNGDYFATAVPSFDYDPSAVCPFWLKWIEARLPAEYHVTLQEIIGYLLTPDNQFHRYFLFLGPPRSGKGTAKGIIVKLVGHGHHVSLMLADLGTEFGLMTAPDKRILIIPDSRDVSRFSRGLALERVLSITGGDEISVPRKYLGPLNLRLPGRLLVLGNKQASWLDESGALAARQIVIPFDRSYEGAEDNSVLQGLHSELPGIANWALEGLRRLRANGAFTVSRGAKELAGLARDSQSPAKRFADAWLIVTGDPKDFTRLDAIWLAYKRWAEEEGLRPHERRNRTQLIEDLVATLRGVKAGQSREPNSERAERPRGLRGVSGLKAHKSHVFADFED